MPRADQLKWMQLACQKSSIGVDILENWCYLLILKIHDERCLSESFGSGINYDPNVDREGRKDLR